MTIYSMIPKWVVIQTIFNSKFGFQMGVKHNWQLIGCGDFEQQKEGDKLINYRNNSVQEASD